MMELSLAHYLILGAILFVIGFVLFGISTRTEETKRV